jgi:hypothetical protein
MDMELSTIRGLIPEKLKNDLIDILNELVEQGYLSYENKWWSSTVKGRTYSGFENENKSSAALLYFNKN